MRIVVDTNVLVSGTIVSGGYSARILDDILSGKHYLVSTPQLMAEFADVMQRPRIARKYPVAAGRASLIANALTTSPIQTEALQIPNVVPDPDDAYLLGCAILGRADALITGDQHLLVLGSYEGVAIMTPHDFVERFGA